MIAPHLIGLRALVSGVPEPRRSGSLLMMLQVLCDESESHSGPLLFVFGGYIATVERWEKLTDAWQRVLNLEPRLDFFSYREAFPETGAPRGQFHGMSQKERDQRVGLFRSIIEHHVLAEIGVGFEMDVYKSAFAGLGKMANNPYFIATSTLEKAIVENLQEIGLPRVPLQFIYDDKKKEEPYILDAWFWARQKLTSPVPPDLLDLFPNSPMFRPSKGANGVIALQAADMFVGWTRACNWLEYQGRKAFPLPGYTRQIPGLFVTFTKDMLYERADRIRNRTSRAD
jgi:hypothetical protein